MEYLNNDKAGVRQAECSVPLIIEKLPLLCIFCFAQVINIFPKCGKSSS